MVKMVGAEYPSAQIAAVTLGYALPTRYLLAAGIDEFTINFDGVGARDPVPTHPLMLNALEALDVNNCIDGLLGTGLHQEVVIYCHELVDSTKQKITTFLILGVISALFLNHKIEKKNEEIAQMQDSILEMEEQ